MADNLEILLKTEDKAEVDKLTKLIKAMSKSEQDNMIIFLHGVKFANTLQTQALKIYPSD